MNFSHLDIKANVILVEITGVGIFQQKTMLRHQNRICCDEIHLSKIVSAFEKFNCDYKLNRCTYVSIEVKLFSASRIDCFSKNSMSDLVLTKRSFIYPGCEKCFHLARI